MLVRVVEAQAADDAAVAELLVSELVSEEPKLLPGPALRPAIGHRPGREQAVEPQIGDPLVVIGHPAGLPLKVADGANVRSIGLSGQHFVANLDTYGGNSGSAVLNGVTGDVEGILVRGEMDFIYQNGCRVSNRCLNDSCRGEDVTLFERVIPYL